MLRALAEAGIRPDALYGTSVGAINAAIVAHCHGADCLDALAAAWGEFAARPLIRPSLAR
jgi:NTE family protein